ncbi:hypothetical protein GCK72_022582 [Caenorhabditis remanei]|uniref:Uncharacterized protein n=1 Tax=Caenorhabditis remanei TaxID=31234 RepID=A0A6A5FUH8_CAERE|nr:hypothetical protein GCK72_022582 [Caenorhabditis remanei]KAF1746129.1 hypothetical protein GCK72_022582 [Caenorhabditis remanei]
MTLLQQIIDFLVEKVGKPLLLEVRNFVDEIVDEALLKTDASEDNAAKSTKEIEEEPIENGTEDALEDVGEDAREDAGENNPPEDDQTARVRGGGRG